MTFQQSVSACLSKYFTFSGRAGRPEFWWFYLFTLLLSWAGELVASLQPAAGYLPYAIAAVLFVPVISAAARRLHDTRRSGWNQLWALTIIGIAPLAVMLALPTQKATNKYGYYPYRPPMPDAD